MCRIVRQQLCTSKYVLALHLAFMKKTFHQLTEFTEFGMLPFFSEFGENGWKVLCNRRNRRRKQSTHLQLARIFSHRMHTRVSRLMRITWFFESKRFEMNNLMQFFLPVLFNSQPNEETSRQHWSMGTINFTKISFSMLELLHMISRVELQSDIIYNNKLANIDVRFPRNKIWIRNE